MTQGNLFTKAYVEVMAEYVPEITQYVSGWNVKDEEAANNLLKDMDVETLEKCAADERLQDLAVCMREYKAPRKRCGCGCH